MLKNRFLVGALTISMVLGLNSSAVFAACESDANYAWIRASHTIHQDVLSEIRSGAQIAGQDPQGLYDAIAYVPEYSGFTMYNNDGDLNLNSDDSVFYSAVGATDVNNIMVTHAAKEYSNSIGNYWNMGQFNSFYSGTTPWDSEGNRIGDDICNYYELSLKTAGLNDQIVALEKADKLVAEFSKQSSDPFELANIVNDYLCSNITYDTGTNDDGTSGNYKTFTLYGALINGKCNCTGYAYAFETIMTKLGYPTMNCSNMSHIWNKTRIDGVWYFTDVTFNDTANTDYVMCSEATIESDGKHSQTEFNKEGNRVAYSVEFRDDQSFEAGVLKEQGLFSGDANGFRLSDSITRAEMAALLVKVVGGTDEVSNNSELYAGKCEFTDVPNWAKSSVGYCVENGLVNGIGNGLYGSSNKASKLDFCTVLLRALGTSDVQYNNSDAKAVELGYLERGRAAFADLDRADVVNTVYNAYEAGAIK